MFNENKSGNDAMMIGVEDVDLDLSLMKIRPTHPSISLPHFCCKLTSLRLRAFCYVKFR